MTRRQDEAAGPEGEPAAVAQLPASTSDFTGRCAQIEDLSAALLPGTGIPGRSRSRRSPAAAGSARRRWPCTWRTAIAERFPDGQLYVDLNGAFENALTPETVLGQWLHALGVAPAELPAGLEERAALYRSLLSRRRVLVVLDNARDVQQILPLLPATNACAVLITSRSRLAELPGAYKLSLTSLPDDEATILLAQLVGAARLAAEPEATAELLRACDGMPLALRIAGARLGARANWAVSTLAGGCRIGGVGWTSWRSATWPHARASTSVTRRWPGRASTARSRSSAHSVCWGWFPGRTSRCPPRGAARAVRGARGTGARSPRGHAPARIARAGPLPDARPDPAVRGRARGGRRERAGCARTLSAG